MSCENQKIIDTYFMNKAIEEAKEAEKNGEVPIGAVLVCEEEFIPKEIKAERIEFPGGKNYKMISSCHNRREKAQNALFHAECDVINEGCAKIGSWRLKDCTLYVTLEPCPMCAGAIINARISRVVYGVKDPVAGAFGSIIDLSKYPFNHIPKILCGVEEKQCADILKSFFSKIRASHKKI